jgi:cytochrome c551
VNKLLLTMLALTFAISVAACARNAPAPAPAPSPAPSGGAAGTVDAQAIYKQNCVSCHGTDMSGGIGPNIQNVGARLSAAEMTARITNGGGGMPPFRGTLKEEEIAALVQWLASHK